MKKEIIVEVFSKDNMGIKDAEGWFNPGFVGMKPEQQVALKENFAKIGKGDKLELELTDDGKYTAITILEKGESKDWGDKIQHFEDLLAEAHKKGLMSIKTEMISVDWDKKTAMFKAKVKMSDKTKERTFEAYGDSTLENIDSEKVQKHWIRMAETRAIARALRWATNLADVTDVETDDGDSEGKKTEQSILVE